jgi:hypothetical protein
MPLILASPLSYMTRAIVEVARPLGIALHDYIMSARTGTRA